MSITECVLGGVGKAGRQQSEWSGSGAKLEAQARTFSIAPLGQGLLDMLAT